MKVLVVNSSDIQGGAARASYRLHKSLLAQGINSQMLVQKKSSYDYTVLGPESIVQKIIGLGRPLIERASIKRRREASTLFTASWLPFSSVVNRINEINPDIVHLHWICGGMMRIEDIARIEAPIVWTLHDNWPFTGGCHIMWDCTRYKKKCGACPVLFSENERDLSRKVFNRKQQIFSKIPELTAVGVSRWITECSKSSALLGGRKHVTIPNPLDTNIYKPLDKESARVLWNLPLDKKIVLFGANSASRDINKGFTKLQEALCCLDSDNVELVIFGASEPEESQGSKFNIHYLGYLHDDVSLVSVYSAADVMVVPSIQESFGQTASEAMACETPVVAFSTTGLTDVVDHKENGYLAKPFKADDLAHGIDWVVRNENYSTLSKNARVKVLRSFDSRTVSKRYIDLYSAILDR